jgi:hypothetical protein
MIDFNLSKSQLRDADEQSDRKIAEARQSLLDQRQVLDQTFEPYLKLENQLIFLTRWAAVAFSISS